jgi:hypothetical protein
MNRDDILLFLRMHKEEITQLYGVTRLGLFGSFARGEASEASDIDIAIELVPAKKTLSNFFAFRRYLEKELGRKVDLGIESALKPLAQEMIANEIIHV